MPKTLKFSQFPAGTLQEAVGLANGTNTRGPSGGGGGGAVTAEITQSGNTFAVGNWVTINSSGLYALAQANDIANAEKVGIVIEIVSAGMTFIVQQAGYILGSQNVFPANNLVAGSVYFLDPTIAGAMNISDVSANGEVSMPCFYADSANSGWVLPYRGIVVSGVSPSNSASSDTNIITVNQPGHGLSAGQWVYLNNNLYQKGIGTSLATSQTVGLVISVIDANDFVLQFEGYFSNPNVITVGGLSPSAGTVYYLSVSSVGQMQTTNPSVSGQYSKPVFICDNTTQKSGWILPQRPLPADLAGSSDSNIITVNQALHGFNGGEWVYLSGSSYQSGISTALATSQIVGLVIQKIDNNNFVLQSEGYFANTGHIVIGGIVAAAGTVNYLSPTVAGRMQATDVAVGQYSKPVFICDNAANQSGWIIPQRPLAVSNGGFGPLPGQIAVAATFSASGGIITIRNSFNVASIVRNSVGNYTVNFINPMANTNYYFFTQAGNVDGFNWWGQGPGAAGKPPTTTSFTFIVGSAAGFIDAPWISMMIIAA